MSTPRAAAAVEATNTPTGSRSPTRTISAYEASIKVQQGTSTVQADVYLLVVSEGLSPRALLFPLIRPPSGMPGAVPAGPLFESLARECLRTFRLPPHWSGDLQDFLGRRAILSASGESDFLNTAALGHGFCSAALGRGEYAHTVWDLCSGRDVHLDALQPRARVYADLIASPADVALYTRFVRHVRRASGDTTEVLSHLIRELVFVREAGHQLVLLETSEGGFVLEYEASVGRWLEATAGERVRSSADQDLAHVLADSLNLTSAAEAVAERIRILRQQLGG